jgi:hypothetical protein
MTSLQSPPYNQTSRRWISLFLFLTIFSLPLHFHAATAVSGQINKECACAQGNRTQLGQLAPPATSEAMVSTLAVLPVIQEVIVAHCEIVQQTRAPPHS